MNHQEAHDLCNKHMHRYVGVTMSDGTIHDGIVEHVDEVNLYLAVPIGSMELEQMRAFVPFPTPYPYFGNPYFYPGYGFGRRRFARQVLPLAGLLALSLLPYY
ncbi:hypothetical protein [Paenibacillus alba]|uniref:Phosphatidylinositol kinase n=1 Tax=Paenibacillus alba TaxID=1197127 RepID=A0ABU6G826_9BACL|nr:hypothetical protein [Paenibacillus alba]MEC0230315.1 hypothetical protein [Paenibacillus alba]NQX65390.1 hypothetical protein [Paenibacillus alba]